MGKVNYKDQLADARWQKKKYEILERDNYTCQKCGAKSNLNVHHKSYSPNTLAWDYPNENLITLCDRCHSFEHGTTKPYIGGVYEFEHGDWTMYMICYGFNKQRNEVYLVGLDDGGSWGTPYIECVDLDYFSHRYFYRRNFWDDCTTQNINDDKFWVHELLVKILVGMYKKKHTHYYVSGFRYSDKSVYEYASNKVCDLVNSNQKLLTLFRQLLNE